MNETICPTCGKPLGEHGLVDGIRICFSPLAPALPPYGGHPIVELRTERQHIKIYANGVVEGIEEPGTILNLIEPFMSMETIQYFSRDPYAKREEKK